jgi:hypothetical protein
MVGEVFTGLPYLYLRGVFMTITYDLATNIGKVRLKIGDTSTTAAHFTDDEITYFLTEAGNVINLAAAASLEAWAASLSENAESERIGDYSYSKKSAQNKLDLAAKLREADSNTPVMDWAEFDLENMGEEET